MPTFTSFADLNHQLAQIKGDKFPKGSFIWRLKPHSARILWKSICYWQSVVDGIEPPKRPLAYYQNKLKSFTPEKKAIVQQIAELRMA